MEQLSNKERNENAIEVGLQLIPGVGGALATLYFGRKQEIRFKRLENFYSQLSDELRQVQDKFSSVETHHEESLLSILEKLNEKIEMEGIQYKINCLKKFFRKNLVSPVTEDNFDRRSVFLNIISDLTVFECKVLLKINSLNENESISAFDISKATDEDKYYAGSAIHRLRNFGLIGKDSKGIIYRGNLDSALLDRFKVSDFGKDFIRFCMQQD